MLVGLWSANTPSTTNITDSRALVTDRLDSEFELLTSGRELVTWMLLTLLRLFLLPRMALVAENLFLRKQLAMYQERGVMCGRTNRTIRAVLVFLGQFFNWKEALVVVRSDTFIRWHRNAFRLWWRWKSKPLGRPPIPAELRSLIRDLHRDNPTWGEQRIANELNLKLGIAISPRTVGKYLKLFGATPLQSKSMRWSIFVRNHAKAVVACDFFQVVTARFRVVVVFVAMEAGSRRILHHNVTAHPTAEWTIQQLREFLPFDHGYKFLIHDRGTSFSTDFDLAVRGFGLRVLRTPFRTPQANGLCERLIGTIRHDCLDYFIPVNERHLQSILREFTVHYNRGRPHSMLGPGIPEPIQETVPASVEQHKLPNGHRVKAVRIGRLAS